MASIVERASETEGTIDTDHDKGEKERVQGGGREVERKREREKERERERGRENERWISVGVERRGSTRGRNEGDKDG